ncbi:hypothetical protein F5144DRAFT_618682 [Chaetomium tenue]|uniref:Uncharacterized protein n=1 Tax=Chaetomium tenue TaxID=1854479 RepID=A0ACB7PK02_9PEZI|nr:hypothetical protein F5144DRAFT_618682 [Chaetomium globosum]
MSSSGFARCLVAALGGNSSLVAFPSDGNYSALVAPYNLDFPVVPAAVAFPTTASQVSDLVSCAVESGYKVQAKSGGHSAANFGSTTGELSINLQNLRHFSMDSSTFVAEIGPGFRLGEVDELTYNAGQRFIPHGASADVGVGGHATVGGAGYTWRRYGMMIDHLREVEVVLANSTIVRASASHNPDLFFAIRGAGAGFGIVTEFVFNTLPAPPQTVSFSAFWNTTDTATRAEVFKAWQAWTLDDNLPIEIQSIVAITQDTILIAGAYFGGTLDDLHDLGLPELFPPAQNYTAQSFTNFLELSQLWAGQVSPPGAQTSSSFYIESIVFRPETTIPNTVVDQVFEYIATTESGAEHYDIEIEAGGGQNAAVAASATAFPHRDATFIVFTSAFTEGNVTPTTSGFVHGLHTLLKSGHPDEYYGQYAGFVTGRQDPDEARRGFWGTNLPRLGQIKAAYDPRDVFHNDQSVLPSFC